MVLDEVNTWLDVFGLRIGWAWRSVTHLFCTVVVVVVWANEAEAVGTLWQVSGRREQPPPLLGTQQHQQRPALISNAAAIGSRCSAAAQDQDDNQLLAPSR
ncbi:hypothetical protein DM02DRAFT_619317 [Periconia macrospinosa]|uniref:Uncharacterized protein n=1 Tax=Periconia macrospinosa TaxID=97972 RepID=A0A2V1D5Q7_9PLEO|nr:hypothetical protein DM02DRAFT_619317 [Periconia macrospinosa]